MFKVSTWLLRFVYEHLVKKSLFNALYASSTTASRISSVSIIAEVERTSLALSLSAWKIRRNRSIWILIPFASFQRNYEMRRPTRCAPTLTFLGNEKGAEKWKIDFNFCPRLFVFALVWEIALMTKQCDWKADINLSFYTFLEGGSRLHLHEAM